MPPPEVPLTRFGATLLKLMIDHGVTTWRGLSVLLEGRGHRFGSASFSNWAHGRSPAPKALPPAVAEAFGLDAAGRAMLAHAFAYGQDVPAYSGEPAGREREEQLNAHTSGVKVGAGGEALDAMEVIGVLNTFGQDGARMYLLGFQEGAAYRRRKDGR